MSNPTINRISSYIILGLCLFAMFLVIGASVLFVLGKFNPVPGGDEGMAARLFQLAIALLVPTGLVFLATADWRRPKEVAKRLVIPAIALIIAFSTLYYMEHLQ